MEVTLGPVRTKELIGGAIAPRVRPLPNTTFVKRALVKQSEASLGEQCTVRSNVRLSIYGYQLLILLTCFQLGGILSRRRPLQRDHRDMDALWAGGHKSPARAGDHRGRYS
jgi:hypothetical protein